MGERNYISTTAGLLADVLYRQDRYDESAEFAGICEDLASDTSDQLELQGNGLLDCAEVKELAGAPAGAADLSERAALLFERKGNVVSARKARQLAGRLRSTTATS